MVAFPGLWSQWSGLSLSILCCLRGYLGKATLHLDREKTKGTQGLCLVCKCESGGRHPASGEGGGVQSQIFVLKKNVFTADSCMQAVTYFTMSILKYEESRLLALGENQGI